MQSDDGWDSDLLTSLQDKREISRLFKDVKEDCLIDSATLRGKMRTAQQ